jgi:hypothetical protein
MGFKPELNSKCDGRTKDGQDELLHALSYPVFMVGYKYYKNLK